MLEHFKTFGVGLAIVLGFVVVCILLSTTIQFLTTYVPWLLYGVIVAAIVYVIGYLARGEK